MAQPLNFWSRFFNGAASFQIDGSFQVVTKNSLDQLDIKLQSDVPSSGPKNDVGGWKLFLFVWQRLWFMVMFVRYIPGLIVYCNTFFWDLSVNNFPISRMFSFGETWLEAWNADSPSVLTASYDKRRHDIPDVLILLIKDMTIRKLR